MLITDLAEYIIPAGYRLLAVSDVDVPVLGALNALWARIREQDGRVPGVVIDLQPGRTSSCGTTEWTSPAPVVVLNLKDKDGEKLAGREILTVLLHLAAHGAGGVARGAEGRYHNQQFADAAQKLGLSVVDTPIPGAGYSPDGLARGTLTRYAPEIGALDKALARWQPVELRKRDRGPLAFACSCTPPRRLRTNAGVADKGPIVCSICGQPFLPTGSSS